MIRFGRDAATEVVHGVPARTLWIGDLPRSMKPRRSQIAVPDLLEVIPDLVLLLGRDGTVLRSIGGESVRALRPRDEFIGGPLTASWPEEGAEEVMRLVRRAIALRTVCDATLLIDGAPFEVRVSAQSQSRAICTIRAALSPAAPGGAHNDARPLSDRRQFWARLTDSVGRAILRERPLALAVIPIEGMEDIAQAIDSGVADQVLDIALRRISFGHGDDPDAPWYIGPLSDGELALVIDSSAHSVIAACIERVCQRLSEPIQLGDATFHLSPHSGVAVLGKDAGTQKALLEHARAAAAESGRAGSGAVSFFSDTMKLRALIRMDMAEELRDAISNRDVRLRYRGRYDLATGRLVAWVGYLRWAHPVRGEIRPAQIVSAAAATGVSTLLSRSLLDILREDFAGMSAQLGADVRISFGALRHHVLDDIFATDVLALVADHAIPAHRLELRISERTYISRNPNEWRTFADAGVQLVVDEVGRRTSSVDRLARAPLWGLQLDRSCALAVEQDSASRRVCGAIAGMAQALGLVAVATGVDSKSQCAVLSSLGYAQGIGDCFEPAAPVADGVRTPR